MKNEKECHLRVFASVHVGVKFFLRFEFKCNLEM